MTSNQTLHELLTTGSTSTPEGDQVALHSHVSAAEVAMLGQLVAELQPQVSLEIGLAYGVSALAICAALPPAGRARHIVVDPLQSHPQAWRGIGMHNLRRAGFAELVELYEEESCRVLPRLEAAGLRLDFAFIDGAHTFDYALVDFFYVNRMLRVGGVVVFDDADWWAIRRVLRFAVTNLCYSVCRTLPPAAIVQTRRRRVYERTLAVVGASLHRLRRLPGMEQPISRTFGAELLAVDARYGLRGPCIALRKQAEDARPYDFHREF
jgi:predicted O-methyltransferase YrrM